MGTHKKYDTTKFSRIHITHCHMNGSCYIGIIRKHFFVYIVFFWRFGGVYLPLSTHLTTQKIVVCTDGKLMPDKDSFILERKTPEKMTQPLCLCACALYACITCICTLVLMYTIYMLNYKSSTSTLYIMLLWTRITAMSVSKLLHQLECF